eukprot:TRINITY_DN28430_c0_g1_i4.p2 TRINITY_DN28430_c0_g1~~TRINITY_DN28430_c0_g1_i4.p2  ORF type:complete len:243 (+),score=36.79 TRINITY_DN28430_c0_g1_i4:272-1000(+)
MGKLSFKSLKLEHAINDKVTVAKTTVGLPKDVKATFGYKVQASEPTLEMEHSRWDFKYNVKSKDCEGKLKFKTDIGKLKIKQKVAKSDFANTQIRPTLELETSLFSKEDFKDKLELSYDTGKKLAAVTETLKFKDKHELKVKADSNTQAFQDLSVEAKSKVKKSILNDVGVKYSKAGGPALVVQLAPIEGAELDVSYFTKTNLLVAELEYKKDKAIFEVTSSVNTSGSGLQPKTKVGLKYSF